MENTSTQKKEQRDESEIERLMRITGETTVHVTADEAQLFNDLILGMLR